MARLKNKNNNIFNRSDDKSVDNPERVFYYILAEV